MGRLIESMDSPSEQAIRGQNDNLSLPQWLQMEAASSVTVTSVEEGTSSQVATLETGPQQPVLRGLRQHIFKKRIQAGQPKIEAVFTPPPVYKLTPEEEEKRERRKDQNRRAARKCRAKKRTEEDTVRQVNKHLLDRNRRLRVQVQKLQDQVAALMDTWHRHTIECNIRSPAVEQRRTPDQCLQQLPRQPPNADMTADAASTLNSITPSVFVSPCSRSEEQTRLETHDLGPLYSDMASKNLILETMGADITSREIAECIMFMGNETSPVVADSTTTIPWIAEENTHLLNNSQVYSAVPQYNPDTGGRLPGNVSSQISPSSVGEYATTFQNVATASALSDPPRYTSPKTTDGGQEGRVPVSGGTSFSGGVPPTPNSIPFQSGIFLPVSAPQGPASFGMSYVTPSPISPSLANHFEFPPGGGVDQTYTTSVSRELFSSRKSPPPPYPSVVSSPVSPGSQRVVPGSDGYAPPSVEFIEEADQAVGGYLGQMEMEPEAEVAGLEEGNLVSLSILDLLQLANAQADL